MIMKSVRAECYSLPAICNLLWFKAPVQKFDSRSENTEQFWVGTLPGHSLSLLLTRHAIRVTSKQSVCEEDYFYYSVACVQTPVGRARGGEGREGVERACLPPNPLPLFTIFSRFPLRPILDKRACSQANYSGTPLYGHLLITNSCVYPD